MLLSIYLAGLAQAVLLVCALAVLPVRKSGGRWLLVAMLIVFSLMLGEELVEGAGIGGGLGLGLALEFALGPLLYLFVRALVAEGPATRRRDLVFFVPMLLAGVGLAWLHLGFPGPGVSLSRPDMRGYVAAIALVKIPWFFAFSIASLRVPIAADPPRRGALLALRALVGACIVIYSTTALGFIAFLFRLSWMPDSDEISAILLTVSIYAIGYFCLVNRSVFETRPRYSATPMSVDEAAGLARRAEQVLAATDAFRNPAYGLAELATALNVAEARLSQALNTAPGVGGFHLLVARRRVAAFRDAAMASGAEERTVLDLAFEAGFNSKATFYRAFQAVEGLTPNQFRARLPGAGG